MAQTQNPYSQILGDRNPKDVISQTPEKLKSLASTFSGEKASLSYAPGKWTAREILAHLADCEIAFSFRLRQAAAETDHVIQPFDQDAWSSKYKESDPKQAIEVFCVLRAWNMAFLKAQGDQIMSKPVTHPERGQMTFLTIVQTMGGHDLNHLRQLETIAGSA